VRPRAGAGRGSSRGVVNGGRVRAVTGVVVRRDEQRGGGQPQCGEQHAAENVGGVMLTPVHAGQGDHDRHDDRRDQEQVAPPAAGVADDQDGDGDVETGGRGHVT